VENYIGIKTLT